MIKEKIINLNFSRILLLNTIEADVNL